MKPVAATGGIKDAFVRVPLTTSEQARIASAANGAAIGAWIRQQVLLTLADFVLTQAVAERVAREPLPPDTNSEWCFRVSPGLAERLDAARGYAARGRWVRSAILERV